jgi:hypothetical protein
MNYEAYLNGKEWELLRILVLQRDKNKCRLCSRRDCLEVHHLTYKRIGHERMSDLVTLCDRCHNDMHWIKRGIVASENMVLQSIPITKEVFVLKAKSILN